MTGEIHTLDVMEEEGGTAFLDECGRSTAAVLAEG